MNLIPKKRNFDLDQDEFVLYNRDYEEIDFESDLDGEDDENSNEDDEIFD